MSVCGEIENIQYEIAVIRAELRAAIDAVPRYSTMDSLKQQFKVESIRARLDLLSEKLKGLKNV